LKSGSAKWFAEHSTVPAPKGSFTRHRGKIHSIRSIWFALPLASASGSSFIPKERTTDAELAMIEVARVEKQEAPAGEAERQNKSNG
jgi:hypothetical protein